MSYKLDSCVDPKNFAKYSANGTGRDYYVAYSNGGLTRDQVVHSDGYYERASIKKTPSTPSLPNIVPKFQHYPNDGSGRDFYITINEGGQLGSTKNYNYLKHLRRYDKSLAEPMANDFLRRTPYTNQRQKIKSQLLANSQRELIMKLTSPKNTKR